LPDPAAGGWSAIGADVSSLQRARAKGAKYFDEEGSPADPLQLLASHGVNYIRLRVWVNPAHGTNTPARILEFAPEIKARGLRLLLDFHYSDTWADPLHQEKPAAWAGFDFQQLQGALYDHTYQLCRALAAAGSTPDMVQVGNEITPGMLLPDGGTEDWEKLAALLRQGYAAVKEANRSSLVMLHIDRGGDNAASRAWFDGAAERGVAWDVTGLSYYACWHGPLAAMAGNVADLKARYGRPVIIVETAYPFTLAENDSEINSIHSPETLAPDFPATPAGQAANLRAVIQTARRAGAAGVFYWEPTWTAVKGNGWDPANPNSGDQWENQALFDFNGKALPAMKAFRA
jgi:arabinogalactan endo-1,4-beta-galactosidase